MAKPTTALGAFAALLLSSTAFPTHAANTDDLAAIRLQMEQMQADYSAKMKALERRVEKAEAEAKAAKAALSAQKTVEVRTVEVRAETPPPAPPPPVPQAAPVSASAFNPAISAVLNGGYSYVENDPGAARIPGFILGEEGGLPDRGFTLGESEIAVTASVDPYFFANLIVALGREGDIGVEEAYIQSTSLPYGFTLKAGRFFSGIGYLNEKHAHNWDFVDAPLPYRAMLENQYGDDGVQVTWLAPIDQFLEFGAEYFRGDAFPAGNAANDGAGTYSAYVHTGGDIDDSISWLAGASYLHTEAVDRDNGGEIFNGEDKLGILSLVLKWAPNGNPVSQNLILSSEYFLGHQTGDLNGAAVDMDRNGWYVQGVYQFMPQWRVGLRHDALSSDDPTPALIGTSLDNQGHDPSSNSVLVEYDTSEFGRFRLQYTADESDIESNNVVSFQYTVIIGPHGAHRF